MTRYLISFDHGAMAHIPDGDWPAVGEAAHAVVREAKRAGVWIHGGGVERQRASIVGIDDDVADWDATPVRRSPRRGGEHQLGVFTPDQEIVEVFVPRG